MKNILKSEDINRIKRCGKILKQALLEVRAKARPGVTTLELDRIAEEAIKKQGAEPSFKFYEVKGAGAFPASLCVSVNDEVVHGLPKEDKILENGDIISLDLGAVYNGIYTDSAITFGIGEISAESRKLIQVTRECLEKGIKEAVLGNHIGDIGHAIQSHAEKYGYGVVRDLVGHGIGTAPHMEPQIPNFGKKGSGIPIENGMALAIEPMLTMGGYNIRVSKDGWTVKTQDQSLSAHFEHTVIITNGKPLIVTA